MSSHHRSESAPAGQGVSDAPTPRADGFAMPPEWEAHQLTLMSWPCRPETFVAAGRGFGPEAYQQAQVQQAAVANAVSAFEPVLMLVREQQLGQARRMLSSGIERYLQDDRTVWEQEPMRALAREGQLACYRHSGFWRAMDTLRDRNQLEQLWRSGGAPWRTWA